MNEGGFDLVTASGDASLRLIAGKRVQEINTALIPSWKTVDERLQNAPWHTVDGKHYGVPYQWGPNVLMYNTEVFKDAAEELERRLRGADAARRQVEQGPRPGLSTAPIYIADAALYLMAHKPELGIKDPYELNEDQYKAALDLLRQQQQLVQRYWHDATVQIDDFTNEGVVASGSWPFQVNLLQAEKKPIASTVPDGRGHRLGRHHDDARRRRASELRLHVAGALARARSCRATSPPGSARCRRCPPPARATRSSTDEGCKTNGFDNFDKIQFWRTPVAKCATPGRPACPITAG